MEYIGRSISHVSQFKIIYTGNLNATVTHKFFDYRLAVDPLLCNGSNKSKINKRYIYTCMYSTTQYNTTRKSRALIDLTDIPFMHSNTEINFFSFKN